MFLNHQARLKLFLLNISSFNLYVWFLPGIKLALILPAGWVLLQTLELLKSRASWIENLPLSKMANTELSFWPWMMMVICVSFFKGRIIAGLFLMSVLVCRWCSSNWHRNPGNWIGGCKWQRSCHQWKEYKNMQSWFSPSASLYNGQRWTSFRWSL